MKISHVICIWVPTVALSAGWYYHAYLLGNESEKAQAYAEAIRHEGEMKEARALEQKFENLKANTSLRSIKPEKKKSPGDYDPIGVLNL